MAEHEAGRTPNPCARCNGEIKFGAFLRRADELGIDAVATGHYVRTDRRGGRLRLLRGADRAKDQSYMLHMLGQRELSRSRFPVGGMPKADTRAAAERFGLPVANKPDSQELCFAPSGEAGAYLASVAPHLMREGEVVDTDGRVLARHGGSAAFTVGQRRGLGVSGPEPSYVLEIDPAANRVIVGPGELLARSGAIADRVSWVAGEPPSAGPFEAEVRIRYRGDDVVAVVEPLRGHGPDRVPDAAARRRARAERGRLPRRRAARRRSHRRRAPLSGTERGSAPDEPGTVGRPGYHRPVKGPGP